MNIDALKKLCEFEHCRMETNDDYAQRLADHVFSLKPIFAQLCRVAEAAGRMLERVDVNQANGDMSGIGEYRGGPAFVVKELRDSYSELEKVVQG